MTPYAEAAASLSTLGYTTIPLIDPSFAQHAGRGKAPGEYRGGHWQGMSKWQRFRDVAPSGFDITRWSNMPAANAGIVLGTSVGRDLHVIALDFDAVDPDALDTLLRAAPASPMVKRGQKGETRFYLAPKTLKTASYDGPDGRLLDRLTGFDTRQTVVPPSVHPETGQPYVWTRGPVPVTELPVLTEEDMNALEEALESCGWERGGRGAAQRTPKPVPDCIDPDDPFERAKSLAMQSLDKWVPHLDLYGLRPARGGYECVESWRSSGTGRALADRKRNLSIQPDGIKDWGSNNTYSSIDLVMAARECSQGEALAWLEERLGLGVEGVVLDLQIGGRSSEGNHPQTPATTAFEGGRTLNGNHPDHDLPEPLRNLPYTDVKPAAATVAPVSEHIDGELPDALTRVPGLVGAITDWIADSARKPQRAGALLAALELVGTAAGRKFAGPTLTGTHLYGLFLAPSGAAKDHPLKCIGRVMHASTMAAHYGPGGFMSLSAVIARLTRQPLTLTCIDEFGAFLGRINGRKASTHERAITGILRSAWGSSFDTMAMPEWAGRVGEPVHSPALSLYGVSTHEEFFENLEGGDVFNGFLNRFLIFSTQQRVSEREPTADKLVVPPEVIDGMLSIYQAGNPLMTATSHNGQADGPMIIVPWDDRFAHQAYMALGERIERMEHDAVYYTRTAEMAQRLATVRAIGRAPLNPRITLEDMDWGAEIALWSAQQTVAMAREYMSATQHQGEAQRVVRCCRRSTWTTYREIARTLNNRMPAKQLREMLDGLVDAGALEMQETRPEAGGHKVKSYRLV